MLEVRREISRLHFLFSVVQIDSIFNSDENMLVRMVGSKTLNN